MNFSERTPWNHLVITTLEQTMKNRGWSQKHLAAQTHVAARQLNDSNPTNSPHKGVSKNRVGEIFNGHSINPNRRTLLQMAVALGIDLEALKLQNEPPDDDSQAPLHRLRASIENRVRTELGGTRLGSTNVQRTACAQLNAQATNIRVRSEALQIARYAAIAHSPKLDTAAWPALIAWAQNHPRSFRISLPVLEVVATAVALKLRHHAQQWNTDQKKHSQRALEIEVDYTAANGADQTTRIITDHTPFEATVFGTPSFTLQSRLNNQLTHYRAVAILHMFYSRLLTPSGERPPQRIITALGGYAELFAAIHGSQLGKKAFKVTPCRSPLDYLKTNGLTEGEGIIAHTPHEDLLITEHGLVIVPEYDQPTFIGLFVHSSLGDTFAEFFTHLFTAYYHYFRRHPTEVWTLLQQEPHFLTTYAQAAGLPPPAFHA